MNERIEVGEDSTTTQLLVWFIQQRTSSYLKFSVLGTTSAKAQSSYDQPPATGRGAFKPSQARRRPHRTGEPSGPPHAAWSLHLRLRQPTLRSTRSLHQRGMGCARLLLFLLPHPRPAGSWSAGSISLLASSFATPEEVICLPDRVHVPLASGWLAAKTSPGRQC